MRTKQEIEEYLTAAQLEANDMREAAKGADYAEERRYFQAESGKASRAVSILNWVLGSKEEDEKARRVAEAIAASKEPSEADLPF